MEYFIKKKLLNNNDKLNNVRSNEKWLLRHNFQKEYKEILKLTNFLPEETKLSIRCHHILKGVYEIPKCIECGKETKWNPVIQWYRTYCSITCMNNSKKIQEKKKQTCQKNFGVDNPSQSKIIKNKKEETCLKNNGVRIITQDKNEKIKRGFLNLEIWLEQGNKRIKGNGICLHYNCNEETKWTIYSKKQLFHVYCDEHKGFHKRSKLEIKISNFIENNFNVFIYKNYRKLIYPYEIDIYIPSKKLAIEINGDFYHGNPLFYEENDFLFFIKNKKIKAKDIWEKDKVKIEKCKKKGIELLTIWENDINNNWDKVKKNIKGRLF